MSRVADYTILGFLYQFNKTLHKLLTSSQDDVITVEGIIEDIDITSPNGTNAVQCKYHEATSFSLSVIYKPILQMMSHYIDNAEKPITYTLYCYFPDGKGIKPTEDDLDSVLATGDAELQKYAQPLRGKIDVSKFFSRFTFELGLSFDELEKQVILELGNQVSDINVDLLIYPNAINEIAKLSTKHQESERKITKRTFIEKLRNIKTIAITRWTLALKSKDKLLREKKRAVSTNLKFVDRVRYFVIERESVADFDREIVNFIEAFLKAYHSRAVHKNTPAFYLDCSEQNFSDILKRLMKNNVKICSGYLEGPEREFDIDSFFRVPVVQTYKRQLVGRSFDVRVAHFERQPSLLNHQKCNDLFVISKKDYSDHIDLSDLNVEYFDNLELKELKIIFGM